MDDQVLHCYTWWYMCPTGRQETFVGLAYQPAHAGRQAGNIDRHDNPDKGNKRRPTLCMACAEQMC